MWVPQGPVSTWRFLWGPWSCPARGPSPPTTLVINCQLPGQGPPGRAHGGGGKPCQSWGVRARLWGSRTCRGGWAGRRGPFLWVRGKASVISVSSYLKESPMTRLRWRRSAGLRSCPSAAAAWRRPRSTASARGRGTSAWPRRVWMERWGWVLLAQEARGELAWALASPHDPSFLPPSCWAAMLPSSSGRPCGHLAAWR